MGLQSLKNASWNVLYATVLAGTGVSLFTASYFLVDELQLRYRGNELIERCVHILEGDQCLARRIGGCPYAIFGPSDGRHRRPKLVSSSILNEEGTTKFIDGMFYVRGPESKNGFAIIKARSMLVS